MIRDKSSNSLRLTSKKQKNSSENKKGATPKRAYRNLNVGDKIKPIYSGQDDQLLKVPIKQAKPRGTSPKRFFPPGGGDQIPKQNIKFQEEGTKGSDTKIIFKPRVAKLPDRTIRKIRFQGNDFTEQPSNSNRAKMGSPERISWHKTHAAGPYPLKIHYGSPKIKTNKFLDKSCNIRTKISHSRGETTDPVDLSNRRKKRKSLGYTL